nr:integrase, catalytic region, zinc finger, CCHC-type, peptidase aspartic, catalytic [Tanacetum cinerariifolium]
VAFCLGLRFALKALRFVFRRSCVLSSEDLTFCLQRSCVLPQKHCVLSTSKILHFVSKTLRFVFKDLAFCLVQAVAATDDSPAIPEHTTVETPMNMSPENKAHFQAEKSNSYDITRIGDEIYSTVDACQTAQEIMVKVCDIVKQQHKLDKVSYHKLFDILKQYQKEVNELHAERLARNANPLALVAAAQANQDPYYQTSNDPKQAQRDKDMQKNFALIAKYLKKIYKPTNNNLRTSSNSRNKNVDTTPRYKNDNQSGQFGNQRTECRKPKRVKDSAYHKEKILLCKQAEQGVPLQAEQYDWLADTDEEVDEQQLEAHYSYMVKIQEVPTADTPILSHNTCLVETNDSNVIPDSPDMCDDDIQNDQNDVESDDECVVLVNLIANLKLNDSCLVALQNKQTEFEKYKAFNDRTIDYDKLERKLNEALGQLAQKDIEIKEDALDELQCLYLHKVKECDCLAQKLSNQTDFVSKEVHSELLKRFAKVEKHSISLEVALQKRKEQVKHDTVWNEKASNVFRKEREQYVKIQDLKAQLQDKNIVISELKKLIEKGKGKYVETKFDKPSVVQQPNAQRISKPSVLVDSNHFACVTKMLNFVNARTKKPNVVPISTRKPKGHANKSVATPHKKKVASKPTNQKPQSYFRMLYEKTRTVRFDNDQFVPILGYGDLVQENVTINRVYYVKGLNHNLFSVGQFCDANLKMKEKGDLCIMVGYSTQSKGYRVYNKRTRMIVESIHILFDEIKEVFETSVADDTSSLVPQRQKASDYDNSDPVPQRQDVSSLADVHVPSQQELDLLFAPSTPTYVHAEENNNDQAEEEHLPNDEFTNPFCAPA